MSTDHKYTALWPSLGLGRPPQKSSPRKCESSKYHKVLQGSEIECESSKYLPKQLLPDKWGFNVKVDRCSCLSSLPLLFFCCLPSLLPLLSSFHIILLLHTRSLESVSFCKCFQQLKNISNPKHFVSCYIILRSFRYLMRMAEVFFSSNGASASFSECCHQFERYFTAICRKTVFRNLNRISKKILIWIRV